MQQLLVFINKEFKHIFRDKRTLLILFGMPIAQVFLFGYAITNEVKDAEIAVWDQSQDYLSKKLTAKVVASEYFTLAGIVHSYAELSDGFREGDYKIAMVIPPKFAGKFSANESKIQLLLDASDPNMASILSNYCTAIIQSFMFIENGFRSPQVIVSEVRMTYNPELKGAFLFVPGVITIILMLISTLLTSIALTREKELGTMEILLVSPLQPLTIVLGKVLPYLILSFSNALVILLLGVMVFGMPVLGSLPLLLVELVLFILAALSVGILISTKAQSQQVAMMVSLFGLMLPTIMLSGFIFPIASMPVPLQILSNIMPAKFFIIIVKGIMLQGVGLEVLWQPTLVIIGFIILFAGLSIKNFKIRLG
jgi:ABC-2 type transport system permease protein